MSRRLDILFDTLKKNGFVTNIDIDDVNIMFDGFKTTAKKTVLRRDFQLLSGEQVITKKIMKKKVEVEE
jgi:hypothetical protein